MTNPRIAYVLAEIQIQYVLNMGIEHSYCARLLIFLVTCVLCMHSHNLSMLQTTVANGCEYRRSY
jgi:hypothetical protein